MTCRKGNCQLKTNPKWSFIRQGIFEGIRVSTSYDIVNSDHQPPLLRFVAICKETHVSININKMCICSVDQYECDMFYDTLIFSVLFFRCHSVWTQLKNSFDIVDMNEINNRQFNFEMIV